MSSIRFIAAIIFGLLSLQVQADDVMTGNPEWVAIESSNGLIVQIPATTTDKLLDQVRQRRSRLLEQRVELVETVEETRFDTGDFLISLILPGGLAYASYLKLSHDRAQDELASVCERMWSCIRN